MWCGALDIFSWPPETIILFSSNLIDWNPETIDLKPDPHTWFIIYAGFETGIPACMDACLAGFWPRPK